MRAVSNDSSAANFSPNLESGRARDHITSELHTRFIVVHSTSKTKIALRKVHALYIRAMHARTHAQTPTTHNTALVWPPYHHQTIENGAAQFVKLFFFTYRA